ncbi:MAG: response regulator [Lachnospiraceae bacterium]|jgi:signal transduction histidine kinase|nr:response regulator [Lachnospiraceae bacterium]
MIEWDGQEMDESPEQGRRRRERILPLTVAVFLAVLSVSCILIFYKYLNNAMFQERNSHFIEITDKTTLIIESEVVRYRDTARMAEHLLMQKAPEGLEELPVYLKEISRFLELDQGTVLAFDSEAHIYRSDGRTGEWRNTEILSGGEKEWEVVTTLDTQADDSLYMLFIKALDSPQMVGEERITHVGVAIEIGIFQDTFEKDIFHGKSHVYVVGENGCQLFRHRCEGGFIDSYDMLEAMEEYSFLHGGTLEDLKKSLEERESSSYEFHYGSEKYFVAVSPVPKTDWYMLTYVPTRVLGAHTAAFINATIIYISFIAVLAVILVGLILYFVLDRRGSLRLIEHQKQANGLLRDAADAAKAASMAKSDFLSHMSHDIRTPINGIMGMTDIALKNLNNQERVLDCLKKIQGSSGHLLSLVNDVLDMSRIESGKTKIVCGPMELKIIAGNCASIVGGHLQSRNLELVEEFEKLTHPHVLGDELHLRQVLINILGNAVKFTPDGGKIYFRLREISAEGDMARFRFEVEDTGIGMKPEFLPHIFDAFAQEDDGNRSNYKGTGLGMAITKKFVDLMGGTIEVESRINEGSRFTVEIPMQIDREYEEGQEEERSREGTLSGLRILVAEDNELNLEITQYILEDEGIEVTAVMDGQEALEAFADSEPGTFACILMDVMMPVMDGLAATRAIRLVDREDAKTIPIIAMTANAYEEDKRRCLEAGMNEHVSKPIDGELLFQVLIHHLKKEQK